MGKYVIISDVRQAFLNVEVCEKDKNYLRFLFTDPDNENEVIIYSFNRVCFGITSSPFLLGASLHYHMNSLKNAEPYFVGKFIRDLYVDDLTSAVKSVEEGVRYHKFVKEAISMAAFNMHKWFSSSAELRNVINCNEGNKIFKNVLG